MLVERPASSRHAATGTAGNVLDPAAAASPGSTARVRELADATRRAVLSRQLARWLGGTIVILLLATVLLLLARRLAGAPQQPLAVSGMLAAAAGTWLLGLLVRAAWLAPASRPWNAADWFVAALPTVVLLLLAGVLWLPATTAAALAAYGTIFLLAEGLCWGALWRLGGRSFAFFPNRSAFFPIRSDDHRQAAPGPAERLHEDEPSSQGAVSLETEPEESWPEGLVQQVSRNRLDDGTEVVYGVLRADFADGERQQALHLAFSPPLAAVPRVSAHQSDGPDARVKVADAQTYGLRLEVRLAAPAEPPEPVWVEVEAVCEPGGGERTGLSGG